jgi:hypothetical protein
VFKRPIALLAFFLKGTTVPEDVTWPAFISRTNHSSYSEEL